MLSGSVLSVWNKVERVLVSMPGGNSTKMQVIRLRTDDNQRIVGKLSSELQCGKCKSFTLNTAT